MSNQLDQLCDLYGVLPRYNDIWGNSHYPSEAAKRALLEAMGVAANTEEKSPHPCKSSSGKNGIGQCLRYRWCANRRGRIASPSLCR